MRKTKKVTVVTIPRKARPQDYARAAAKASPVINNCQDNIVDDVKEGLGVVKSIFGGRKYTADQQAFYDRRDQVFDMINNKYGKKHYEKLPGNPFTAFAHEKYKVMGTARLPEFYAMVDKYYPGLLTGNPTPATVETSVIKPLGGVMGAAVGGSSGSVATDTKTFVEQVVAPATGKDYTGVADEVLENAAIDFMATLIEKKRNGETLPPLYDKIASGAMKVENTVKQKVKTAAAGSIGTFAMENPLIVGGVILFIGYVLFAPKK